MIIKSVNLPRSITLKNWSANLNWTRNNNLDGFRAAGEGFPISAYASSEDAEIDIWDNVGIKSDVYADGSFELFKSIGASQF